MNFKTTLILLVLLTGVAVFILFANHGSAPETSTESTNPADVAKGAKLFDTKADNIDKLVVRPGEGAPSGSKTLELSKVGAKWELLQPVAWPADSFDAPDLVKAFVDLRTHGKVELTSENRSATGLDKPRYLVELTDKDGKTIKLSVGNRRELGNDLYVSTDDGKSGELVSAGTLGDKLDKGTGKLAESLRDKQIVRVTSSAVKQIKVTHGGEPPLVLNKVGDDWKLVSPREEDADSTAVSDILSTVTNLRADDFVNPSAPEVSRARFDTPRVTVWLNTASPTTKPATAPSIATNGVTVTIGEPTDVDLEKAYVKVSDPSVIAKASITQADIDKLVNTTALSLRDKSVVNIDPAKVSEVSLSIDRPSTTQPTTRPAEQVEYQIERRKENLILGPVLPTEPPKPATPATAPAAPVTAPSGPATRPSTEPAAAPTTKPSGASSRADLLSPFLALTGELSAGPATRPTTQPAAAPTTEPATAPATEPTAAPATTRPTTEPQAHATETHATETHAAAHATPVVPPPPASKWVLKSRGGASADDQQVTELLDALHPLKVEKYLESAPTTQPTANYVLTIKTIGAGGAETANYELRIVDPGGEAKLIGHYKDLTFELDRSLLKKLDGDFETKRPPEPAAAPNPHAFPGGAGGFPGGFRPGGE